MTATEYIKSLETECLYLNSIIFFGPRSVFVIGIQIAEELRHENM